ncbi:putative manganese-dependent inorganic diphosphatase [Clostridium sp. AF37-5AT]|nr:MULTISPECIES: putative manganese-dependent inorganic diphosphatase [unclassified Clostridium]RHO03664.1 putative manganese-dependent inorganic diphosphatase [Clostridium sp. AM22-16AC]RHO39136.1 putative manganese-dependent inorganic diphosphatase [Clostridium sp. AM16-23]RHO97150.1 putative manganese-dependent inorganic diphosphatase [Clostridium sp. AF37-5AT]
MAVEGLKKTLVLGHRNPDTDSICSAICYAGFKHQLTGENYEPCRAGNVSPETQYVLDYFNLKAPRLVENVKTQVKDIEIRKTKGVSRGISLKNAWGLMQENNVVTLPCVTEEGLLEGVITIGDITKSYMNLYDSSIISKACTKYANILDTLEGSMVVGDSEAYFDQGKVLIAAANPDLMENYIEKHDLVILGNRYESQLCAIEMEAGCIIVCEGAGVSLTIRKLAQERGCAVITTPYDTYTTARLINQSMPISYFMTKENIIEFSEEDYLDDIREIMASKRHRDFPVLDSDGKYIGMISRRNLLGAKGKSIILVDHNEKSQAVEGMESADIREIIDHHRLGTVETMSPVFFRNQPLGCTATIIYQMYQENHMEIDKTTAGLLCSAIISDTLLFRSPTCTAVDKAAGLALAQIAGLDIEKYAIDMFSAGSNLKGKSDGDIFYQDFKRFTVGNSVFGIGQITSLNAVELKDLRSRMSVYTEKEREQHEIDMMFFMLTNILTESTDLICTGQGAEQLITTAFHVADEDVENVSAQTGIVKLPGVVSRKKQLAPQIMMALQQ